VERLVSRIVSAQSRYETVAKNVGSELPWPFIGIIHCMESGLDFKKHLHNGDPLTARTVHVPEGRPIAGQPPFTWEDSARDALRLRRLHAWSDWSLAGTLYQMEAYNGWGYRLYHPHVLSPYLWSFSNQYVSGKYVQDGTWSDTAVSRQCGGAVLLRRMSEIGIVTLAQAGGLVSRIRYAPNRALPEVAELQRFLNTLPGIFVKVDGRAGPRTSDAFRKATGRYLAGDPRA
jgi:lysozyme family protein